QVRAKVEFLEHPGIDSAIVAGDRLCTNKRREEILVRFEQERGPTLEDAAPAFVSHLADKSPPLLRKGRTPVARGPKTHPFDVQDIRIQAQNLLNRALPVRSICGCKLDHCFEEPIAAHLVAIAVHEGPKRAWPIPARTGCWTSRDSRDERDDLGH